MNPATRLRYLRVALILVGLIFVVGVYPLMTAWWPSGWRWQPNQPEYEHDSRCLCNSWRVSAHCFSKSVAAPKSDLVHGLVESCSCRHYGQAINAPAEHGHLLGDIPALVIVAILLAVLTPRGVVTEKM